MRAHRQHALAENTPALVEQPEQGVVRDGRAAQLHATPHAIAPRLGPRHRGAHARTALTRRAAAHATRAAAAAAAATEDALQPLECKVASLCRQRQQHVQ
eukprot:scaffold22646_cov68-Phaeocystis_antarctica.AAC.13